MKVFLGPPGDTLEKLLTGEGEFLAPERALAGLSPEIAVEKPGNPPYSVAEVLAHMHYWQARVLAFARGGDPPRPEHAAEGWPAVAGGEWDGLVAAYLADLEALKAIARSGEGLERPVREGDDTSVGYLIASNFNHSAHHLGQLVLLRRLLGAWPPPGGGDTW